MAATGQPTVNLPSTVQVAIGGAKGSQVVNTGISRQVPVILPAAVTSGLNAGPTQIHITQPGQQFYVLASSAPISIQGVRGGVSGASNLYSTGQGQKVESGFEILTVSNPNPFPVTALLWVGFDDFINDQLIIVNSSYQQVLFPTASDPSGNPQTVINIPDLSGQTFLDINGKKWGAISRVAILLFNTSTGTSYLVQKSGASSGTGPAVGIVNGGQPIRIDAGGNYTINLGGADIPAIVSEIYNAFPL